MKKAISKVCKYTNQEYLITSEDLDFYYKISPTFNGEKCEIPIPNISPEARTRRKLVWRNERTLYKRLCNLTKKPIISTYSPEAPLPVYDYNIWYSDQWDASTFGRDFDFNKTFFEQFKDLLTSVPDLSLRHQSENENCQYANLVGGNKDCYYIFAGNSNTNCFYSTYIQKCIDCSDCFFIFESELCYECIDCIKCYNLKHSLECSTCHDSEFLFNCRNCSNCFCCCSLTNERYCIFNEKFTEQDYKKRLKEIKSNSNWQDLAKEQLNILKKITPKKYYSGLNNQNFTGDHLINCKNTFNSFDSKDLEDCKNCVWLHKAKDCHDCYAWGLSGELGYENHLCGNGFYQCIFCESCWNNVSYLTYCRACHNGANNLFGCIGLKAKSYCILNKQYNEEEYNKLALRIVRHMKETEEWGEFFPEILSPYGYNETIANEYFPLSATEAYKLGYNWRKEDLPGVYSRTEILAKDVDLQHRQIGQEICGKIIECEECSKNYIITKAEYLLYQKINVSLPKLCFDSRYKNRLQLRNSRRLHQISCGKCNKNLISTYDTSSNHIIYCDKCYGNN